MADGFLFHGALCPGPHGLLFQFFDVQGVQDRGNGHGDGGKGEHDPGLHEQRDQDGEEKDELQGLPAVVEDGVHRGEQGHDAGIVHLRVSGKVGPEHLLPLPGRLCAQARQFLVQPRLHGVGGPQVALPGRVEFPGKKLLLPLQATVDLPVPRSPEDAVDHVVHLPAQHGLQGRDLAGVTAGDGGDLPLLPLPQELAPLGVPGADPVTLVAGAGHDRCQPLLPDPGQVGPVQVGGEKEHGAEHGQGKEAEAEQERGDPHRQGIGLGREIAEVVVPDDRGHLAALQGEGEEQGQEGGTEKVEQDAVLDEKGAEEQAAADQELACPGAGEEEIGAHCRLLRGMVFFRGMSRDLPGAIGEKRTGKFEILPDKEPYYSKINSNWSK